MDPADFIPEEEAAELTAEENAERLAAKLRSMSVMKAPTRGRGDTETRRSCK